MRLAASLILKMRNLTIARQQAVVVSCNQTAIVVRFLSTFILLVLFYACGHKVGPKNLIVGSWITGTAYDSVKSIHTFDENGNYFIDDSSKGKRQRKFTNRYRFSDDGKYLIPMLKGGGEPQMEITKLTNTELELTIGTYTKKYTRYKRK